MQKNILMVLPWALLLAPSLVLGNEPYTAPDWGLFATAHQAFINYDRDTQQEQLTLLPRLSGKPAELIWVIPVPGLPVVETVKTQLFQDLGQLTNPVRQPRDGDWNCFSSDRVPLESPLQPVVELDPGPKTDYYQTMILAASEAPALLDSLDNWGYLSAEAQPRLAEVVADYAARSWYFVTVRVDSALLREVLPQPGGYYSPGDLAPIRLTFPSPDIIYPLQLAALNTQWTLRLNLYVKADHRQTFPGAQTEYANLFSARENASLPFLRDVLRPGDFLTQLQGTFRPDEVDADVELQQADNDNEYLQVIYSGFPWTGLLLLMPLLGLGTRRAYRRRARQRTTH